MDQQARRRHRGGARLLAAGGLLCGGLLLAMALFSQATALASETGSGGPAQIAGADMGAEVPADSAAPPAASVTDGDAEPDDVEAEAEQALDSFQDPAPDGEQKVMHGLPGPDQPADGT